MKSELDSLKVVLCQLYMGVFGFVCACSGVVVNMFLQGCWLLWDSLNSLMTL